MRPDVLFSSIGLRDGREFLPLLLAGCLGISNPAAVSISLGEEIWLLQTLPVSIEADNDGNWPWQCHTFRDLAAWLVCSGLAFLAKHQVVDLVIFHWLILYLQLFQGLWSIFIILKFIWDNEMIDDNKVWLSCLEKLASWFLCFLFVLSAIWYGLGDFAANLSYWTLLLTTVLYRHCKTKGYFKEVHMANEKKKDLFVCSLNGNHILIICLLPETGSHSFNSAGKADIVVNLLLDSVCPFLLSLLEIFRSNQRDSLHVWILISSSAPIVALALMLKRFWDRNAGPSRSNSADNSNYEVDRRGIEEFRQETSQYDGHSPERRDSRCHGKDRLDRTLAGSLSGP